MDNMSLRYQKKEANPGTEAKGCSVSHSSRDIALPWDPAVSAPPAHLYTTLSLSPLRTRAPSPIFPWHCIIRTLDELCDAPPKSGLAARWPQTWSVRSAGFQASRRQVCVRTRVVRDSCYTAERLVLRGEKLGSLKAPRSRYDNR